MKQRFPNLFTGLGKLEGNHPICLKEGAKPFSLCTPHRVAIPLLPLVKVELARMEVLVVIEKVEQPTEWCAGLVVVPKAKCLSRKTPPASVQQTLAQLAGTTVFSTLDANSCFWQIPLSHESALLTTFISPYGWYCFKHLPFGISSAPEHFQR